MKKIYITVLLVLGFSAGIQAQNITYGIKAGVNVSDWRGDATQSISELIDLTGIISTTPSIGYHVGGFLVIPVQEGFSIEPGIIYSRKGMQVKETLEGFILPVTAKASVRSHYLEMPIMAKVQTASGLQIFGGPQVSYLVANRLNAKAGVFGFNVRENFPIDAGFRKVDVALTGGLGYQFTNGTNISASYEHGLSRIDNGGFLDAYNRSFKASIGFVF